MKERYVGLIIAGSSALLMYLINTIAVYQEVKSNYIVFSILILLFGCLGFIIGQLFEAKQHGKD